MNNGTGRDSYIGVNSGGLRAPHISGNYKRTFYNDLRHYDRRDYGFGKRYTSMHTATTNEKQDEFRKSQNHFNHKYVREMNLVHNYQNMLDDRLSRPKKTQEMGSKIYKNSAAKL